MAYSSVLSKEECISKIVRLLKLNEEYEPKQIAEELITEGRQVLRDYEQVLDSSVFKSLMDDNQSELLRILKLYHEQRWKETIKEDELHQFLQQVQSTSIVHYNRVLMRTAEYGSKFSKYVDPKLSLAIQLVFKVDNNTMNSDDTFFIQIWDTMLSQGLQGVQSYAQYLIPEISNNQTALCVALKSYFNKVLKQLFEHPEINISDTESFEKTLDCLTNYGYWNVLHNREIMRLIPLTKFTKLLEKLKEYLKISSLQGIFSTYLRQQECAMIKMCVDENEKFKLLILIEANVYQFIDKSLNDILDDMIKEYGFNQNFPSFIQSCLILIIHLLKRRCILDGFAEMLFLQYSKLNTSLRMMIHILLLKSDILLSQKIMSLLSRQNPVPFLQPSINHNDSISYEFVSNIIHIWNYSFPTIFSFGIGLCKGKSTLINTIFQTSFEKSRSSIYFQNTIDITFGCCFQLGRFTNVADAHGSMIKTIFERIYKLFDGFLIHVSCAYLLSSFDSFLDIFNVIKTSEKYRLLVVRDVPENKRNECRTFLSTNLPGIESLLLPHLSIQNSLNDERLIAESIKQKMSSTCQNEMSFIKSQLESLMDKDYKNYLEDIHGTIRPLEQALFEPTDNKNKIIEYFSEYLKYAQLCLLKSKLICFNFFDHRTDAFVYEHRQKIDELENLLPKTKTEHPNQIYKFFSNILNASNMLAYLDSLAVKLKEKRLDIPILDIVTNIRREQELSLDILWYNAFICSQYETQEVQDRLRRHYYDYIQAGYPFKIADENNFYFQDRILFESLQLLHYSRILIISIIGPQGSDKTILLNSMFGTSFDDQSLRGIHGSLIKTNRTDFEYILLIHTEGLRIVPEDEEHNHRIVLFCLAVSHVVIVNMIDEIDKNFQSILLKSFDSLNRMNVTHTSRCIVHFVFSQRININMENNQAAINEIAVYIKQLELDETIQIQKEEIFPSAFKSEEQILPSKFRFMKITFEFTKHAYSFCSKIIRSVEQYLHQTNESMCSLRWWLSSSKTIFNMVQKFPDLAYYQDSHEHMKNKLMRIFSADYRNRLIEQCRLKTEQDIHSILLDKENEIKTTELVDASLNRTQRYLDVEITETFNSLRASIITMNKREKIKLIIQNVENDLAKLVEDIIHKRQQMSSDTAKQIFDKMFETAEQSLRSQFVTKESWKESIRYIYANYNIYEKEFLLQFQDIIDDESQTPINQIENKLIKRFTNLINQNESIKIHRFKPITRSSLDTIEKFNYLNKDLLCMTATNDRSQLDIRDIIDKRKPIVNENKAFKEVIARVIQEMQIIGDQKIERVVHSVNSLINDINNKLSLFWLSLSRSMKSAMHCCAAILIAKCHLDQTENYLSEVLNELKNRKDHLKTYFNAMIDIGSVNDEKAAIDLSKDFEEYLVRSLNVASESIRNEKLISYESLNRKTIKDQCDEKLFRSEDIQWCLKYIADPIKVIEEFFNNIWNAIPHEINHKCTNRKYHYIDLVEDLFCHIKSKKHI
ncbi:unnamed protein product [Rotaria sp. Silwood1]|nr:unnamed protein product [Rotaria sp. Silwood1]CAF1629106.1 unnamed protein product [Rotaria sp. Silwood1]CAF3745518.1 unnamed protein product [Rotaria sp. Silwood1]CAF4666345.1 unnamed protein product [Rotaria sp. Silwood1]CAF4759399.1 unnamed protein product [Rotaria sp. Silwood1]